MREPPVGWTTAAVRLARSSVFRLTALYVLLFMLSVALIFGAVFVVTQRFLHAESRPQSSGRRWAWRMRCASPEPFARPC